MSPYTQSIYHIIFSTKHREPTLLHHEKKRLYAYIHNTLTNKYLKILIVVNVFFLPFLALQAQEHIDKSKLKKAFKDRNIPCVVFGTIDKSGNTDWLSFGSAMWGDNTKVEKDNIFRIASMTKAITSVAAMQLVEQGIISLDEPLNELMPEMVNIPILTPQGNLVESKSMITLRHLLTHTSGFGYEFIEPRLQRFNKENWPHEDSPRMSEPGELWRYGTSLDWVGKVVEKLSGKDLESYFRDHITGPLGMESTWFNVPENLHYKIVSYGNRADSDFNEFPRISLKKVTSFSGGGGLFGSPEDYLKFILCILNEGKYDNGQILEPKTVKLLFERQLPDNLYVRFDVPEDGYNDSFENIHETDNHSLAWAISNGIESNGKRQASVFWDGSYKMGSGFWSGLYNTYFNIDPNYGFGVVSFMQFLPFGDTEAFELYKIYEKEVYSTYLK